MVDMAACTQYSRKRVNLCKFNDFFFPHVKHHKKKRGGLSIYTRDKQIHQSNKAVVCGSVMKKKWFEVHFVSRWNETVVA
jgi:hypothetical protein